MIRAALWATLGGLAVVGLAAVMLVFCVPRAGAAEACRGGATSVLASWYGKETCNGRPAGHGKGKCETASGVAFNGSQLLMAHKSLPFHSRLRISYGVRSIVVPVEDRGPFIKGRTLDLSDAVARKLGTKAAGVARVCMERVR